MNGSQEEYLLRSWSIICSGLLGSHHEVLDAEIGRWQVDVVLLLSVKGFRK